MHRINKPLQMYSAVLCDSSFYTLVIIEYDPITSLFILHAYHTVKVEHGEFGSHFFINHTYFFKSIIDFFTGAGTGLVISCCISPDSIRRTVILCIGIAMFLIGGVKKLRWDKEVVKYLEKQEKEQ